MSKNLFSEFDPVSAKAFKQKIQYDLQGADYNETLVWHSDEGIDVKPFYHRDDVKEIQSIPGLPYKWNIAEEIFIINPLVSAKTANASIKNGADVIYFKADKPFNCEILLAGIEQKVPLYFNPNFFQKDFL
ncbi:MAG: methylmalonyl-CoA mutase, partial [Leeuwenhoekiella sp.]